MYQITINTLPIQFVSVGKFSRNVELEVKLRKDKANLVEESGCLERFQR